MVHQAIRQSVPLEPEVPSGYQECCALLEQFRVYALVDYIKTIGGLGNKWANPSDPFWRSDPQVHGLKLMLRGCAELLRQIERDHDWREVTETDILKGDVAS